MSIFQRFAILLAALTLWTSAAVAEPGFITGLNDVPLMPGLEPLGETLVFDKPGGRIAEAVFTGRAAAADVTRFYADTLPQLGWQAKGAGHFLRENEELALHVTSAGAGAATVRLVVQPRRR